jgi:hypothetical protein
MKAASAVSVFTGECESNLVQWRKYDSGKQLNQYSNCCYIAFHKFS